MEKVYLVWVGEYSDRKVSYISDSKNKATEIANIIDGYVDERMLNTFNKEEDDSHIHTFSFKLGTGNNFKEYGYRYDYDYYFGQNEIEIIDISEYYPNTLEVYINISNPVIEKAFKIACDKLAKVKEKLHEVGVEECIKLAQEGFEF